MKSNQKLFVMFWLKKSKATADGTAPIYARITIDGLSDEISTGRKAHPDFWDGKTKTVAKIARDSKATNQRIRQVETDLERLHGILQTQYDCIVPIMLKSVFFGKPAVPIKKEPEIVEKKGPDTLLGCFDEFISKFEVKVKNGTRDEGTLRHWRTTRRKVSSFINHQFQSEDLLLSDMDFIFADDFFDHLTLTIDEPLSEVTAKKEVKKVRQVIKPAVKRKIIPVNPLEGFNCSTPDKEVIPLELFQAEKIYRKEISIQRMAEVRDAFIFQCFTGYAYGDIYTLSPQNIIQVGNTGERWLIKDRGKTEVAEAVPILPIVEDLIEKYKSHPYCKAYNRLMPINSNYRYNVYLKELADICGISFDNISANNQELNTHLARHTFAHIMLNNGVPLEDVSKMMGHKSIRTTQRYARVNKARISENVAKVRDKLFGKLGQLKKVA